MNGTPAEHDIASALGVFILVTAAEAFGLNLVWNHVLTLALPVKPLLFGHMFILVLAFKIFFRDAFKSGYILDVLEEIRELQPLPDNTDTNNDMEDKKVGSDDANDK